MFGWTVHTNVYDAGREGGHVVDLGRDAREDLALVDAGAAAVLELDVVGRARVLVDERERERLVGRGRQRRLDEGDVLGVDDDVAARRPAAVHRSRPARPTPAAARAPAGRPTPPRPRRRSRRAAAASRPAGRRRRSAARPAPASSSDGVRGAGRLSRWPVASASSALTYSLRASASQPTRVAMRAITPAASSQPPNTRPSISIPVPIAPRNGRNDGPGMWTPAGGPSWTRTGRSVLVCSPRSWS